MKTAVIGPGAMGILFASRLFDSGADVTLIDRYPARAAILARSGLTMVEGGLTKTRGVRVVPAAECASSFDLALVLVKAPHTREAAGIAATILAPGGFALTLQNGIGGADALAAELGGERVLVGTTAQGSTLLETGRIRLGGEGPTVIGACAPGSGRRMDVVELLCGAGLETTWEDDILPVVWRKLAVNCGINAVTALTGAKNSIVAENPDAGSLCAAAVAEVWEVARASAVDLGNPAELVEYVLSVAHRTGLNRSSMGQDVDRKRPTEVEFINGAVTRLGSARGVKTPVNDTLAALVRALEATFIAE